MTDTLTDEQIEAMLAGCAGVTRFHDNNLMRYEHGGGRLAIIPVPGDGDRVLIADFYKEADREHFTRCDPSTITSLLTELKDRRSRDAHVEGMEKALDMEPGWSLEKNYHNGDEDGDYGWIVYEVSGGRNDREWREIGFGQTPLEALTAAHNALAAYRSGEKG